MDFKKYINNTGYLKGSKTENNPFNIIPTGNISMEGVEKEITAIPVKNGLPQKVVNMKPNENFNFNADYVIEIPKLQSGIGNFFDPMQPQGVANTPTNPLFKPTNEQLIQSGITGTQKNPTGLFLKKRQKEIDLVTNPMGLADTTVDYNLGENAPAQLAGLSQLNMPNNPEQGLTTDSFDGNAKTPQEESNELTGAQVKTQTPRYFNPYGGVDLQTALFKAGQSFNSEGSTGNTIRGIGAVGKSLLAIGRTVGAGMGYANREREAREFYEANQRKALVNSNFKNEDGGLFYFLKNGGNINELTPEQALTGEYITGLPEHAEEKANAEVEVNEYIKHPNGDVQRVVGKTHEKGGEKVNLENGTTVISDHVEIGGDFAKEIRKEYGMKVKAKDTFASIITKYTDKIGLTKLNKEQEELFKKIKKQEETQDNTTQDLNMQFLSARVKEIEDEKKTLEQDRALFTDYIFLAQEDKKGTNLPEKEEVEKFEAGGIVKGKAFKELLKKYNLTEEQAISYIEEYKKGGYKKYQGGGEDRSFSFYKNEFVDDSNLGRNDVQTETTTGEVNYMDSRVANFGFSTDEEQARLRQLQKNFPTLFSNVYSENEDGILQVLTGEDGKLTGRVEEFQRAVDQNYQYLIDEIAPTLPEADREAFIEEINNRRFEENGKRARGFDDKTGFFTSTRTNAIVSFATPKDLKTLNEMGITTNKQLYDKDGNLKPEIKELNLDKETLDKIEETKNHKASYLIGELKNNNLPEPEEVEEEVQEVAEVEEAEPTKEPEGEVAPKGDVGLGVMFLPDQSSLPPDGVQPHLKINRRLERLDPVKITTEENLKEINRSENFAAQQLASMPDSQRRAALANMTANSQENINKAITTTNIANAQNFQQTEQFNINQSNQEENFRAIDTLDFERRQLTALAKTEADLFNFFEHNRKVQLGNFNTINRINTLNSIYENFNTDGSGINLDSNNRVNFGITPNMGSVGLATNVASSKKKTNKKNS